jgi:hypothetical protein
VVISPVLAPVFVITAFVVAVVPCASSTMSAGSTPTPASPFITPSSKLGGVEATFAVRTTPSRTATTSVNVPPVSIPTRQPSIAAKS